MNEQKKSLQVVCAQDLKQCKCIRGYTIIGTRKEYHHLDCHLAEFYRAYAGSEQTQRKKQMKSESNRTKHKS